MKETTLVIMAAGIGSRFGGGIKQLEPVGPGGEIIMDYSIYDALQAGFNKIVFIIRKDLEKDFREVIGNRIEKIAHVEYAFQELDDLPEGFTIHQMRAEHKKSAVQNDRIFPKIGKCEEGYTVLMEDGTGKPYAVVEFR